MATAIAEAAAADVDAFVARFRAGTMTVDVDGETLQLAEDMVTVSETPRSGWTVATGGADTVALDLELTHELRLLGLLRHVVRLVQDARKNAGFEVTDRIELHWLVGGAPAPAEAIRTHTDQLAGEVLASAITEGEPSDDGWHATGDEEFGLHLWIRRA